jgi:hypothetical protein
MKTIIQLFIVTTLLIPLTSLAAVDAYLKLGDIKGESQDSSGDPDRPIIKGLVPNSDTRGIEHDDIGIVPNSDNRGIEHDDIGVMPVDEDETTKESGEKGGTEDINIGVGELQEDKASPKLQEPVTEGVHGQSNDGNEVMQNNETNLDFIRERAGETDSVTPGLILKGKKIRENYKSDVEVRGWDPKEKKVTLQASDIQEYKDLEDYSQALVISDNNIKNVEIVEGDVMLTYQQPVKFLGLFRTTMQQTASVDEAGRVKVRFPWYGFLFKKEVDTTTVSENIALNYENIKIDYQTQGEDAQLANIDLQNSLQRQQRTLQIMHNALKAQHDSAMSVIRNLK